MRKVIVIHDDDEVRIGDGGYTTSGRVLRLLAEDMFGVAVDWYIRDARLGRAIRRWQRDAKSWEDEQGATG